MTGGWPACALGKGKIPTLSLRARTRERICEFSVLETSCIAVLPSKNTSTPSCASSPPKLCVKYPCLAQPAVCVSQAQGSQSGALDAGQHGLQSRQRARDLQVQLCEERLVVHHG